MLQSNFVHFTAETKEMLKTDFDFKPWVKHCFQPTTEQMKKQQKLAKAKVNSL